MFNFIPTTETGPGLFIDKLSQKDIRHLRVEMFSALLANVLQCIRFAPGLSVGTVAGQRIPHINDGEYSGRQWDLLALQALWITGAIPFLVMTIGDIHRVRADR